MNPKSLDEALVFYEPAIRRTSVLYRNSLPGLDYEDVRQEMRVCVVKAWRWMTERTDPVNFNRLFWTLWNRRVVDAIRASRSRVRVEPLPVDVDEAMDLRIAESEPLYAVAELLADLDPEAMTVAQMRGDGWRANEVMALLGLSRREYYRIWNRVMETTTA